MQGAENRPSSYSVRVAGENAKEKPETDISLSEIIAHVEDLLHPDVVRHADILLKLLDRIQPVNFRQIVFPELESILQEVSELEKQLTGNDGSFQDAPDTRERLKLLQKQVEKRQLKLQHYLIICIEQILELAKVNQWGICKQHEFIYLYNGAFWCFLEVDALKTFLGKGAEKMGVQKYQARFYRFKEHLFKQFMETAYLPAPIRPDGIVLINLQNGTFEIGPAVARLRSFQQEDFITYQLPFSFDAMAEAPLFKTYLNQVLPDKERQNILSEFLGYVFISPSTLKLEKALLLYGSGANGKSVFFEIVTALLGRQNVSGYNLQSLTNENGYQRAKLANMLVNYASEINGNMDTAIFKQLVSGEPVEARLPYGEPFMLTQYAKLIFNCNELPKDVEHTNAYFRRFLIIPFDVTIPESEQDRGLASKIIHNELSGVFNWVLGGLKRLLSQRKFTDSTVVQQQLERYKKESDSVLMFLEDEGYQPSIQDTKPLKEVFSEYRIYCANSGYRACSVKTFSERLRQHKYTVERKRYGMAVSIEK
jgi:putative DNA primase/helicase